MVQPPPAARRPRLRGPRLRWAFCGAGGGGVPAGRGLLPRLPKELPPEGWALPLERCSLHSGDVSPLRRLLVHAGPWSLVVLSHSHPASISASPSEGWGSGASPSLLGRAGLRRAGVHPPHAFRLSLPCSGRRRPIGAGAGAATARHHSRSPRSGTPRSGTPPWLSRAVLTLRVERERLRCRNSAVKPGFGLAPGRLAGAAEDGSEWPGPPGQLAPRGPMLLRSYRNPFPWELAPPVGGASRVWRWPTLRLRLGRSSASERLFASIPALHKEEAGLRDEDI